MPSESQSQTFVLIEVYFAVIVTLSIFICQKIDSQAQEFRPALISKQHRTSNSFSFLGIPLAALGAGFALYQMQLDFRPKI
jgi:hypothetical protein